VSAVPRPAAHIDERPDAVLGICRQMHDPDGLVRRISNRHRSVSEDAGVPVTACEGNNCSVPSAEIDIASNAALHSLLPSFGIRR